MGGTEVGSGGAGRWEVGCLGGVLNVVRVAGVMEVVRVAEVTLRLFYRGT